MIITITKKYESGETEVVEVELSEKLNTALQVQKRFGKPYLKAIKEISNFSVEELVGFLTCGLKGMKPDEFKELIIENCGLSQLYDFVSNLAMAIQYPGLSEEEIEKKAQEQQAKAKRMNPGYQE